MTTNPEVLRLAREIVKAHYPEMRSSYSGRRLQIAIAAIERTTSRAVNYAAYQGSSLLYGLKALDHLRQPEKGSTDE